MDPESYRACYNPNDPDPDLPQLDGPFYDNLGDSEDFQFQTFTFDNPPLEPEYIYNPVQPALPGPSRARQLNRNRGQRCSSLSQHLPLITIKSEPIEESNYYGDPVGAAQLEVDPATLTVNPSYDEVKDEWLVEKIIAKKIKQDKTFYRVKWVNYSV